MGFGLGLGCVVRVSSPYQREGARLGGLMSLYVASRKSSCSPLPAAARCMGRVRQVTGSTASCPGVSGTVRAGTAAAASSAVAKTTLADESLTHST